MKAVVAVVAHPDDESLIAGGTLARARRAGAIVLTRGELGPISDAALATPETLGEVRAGELRAAGAALGLEFTECLTHPDGELPWAEEEAVIAELAGVLRHHDAGAVLTFGEDGLYHHPDHVAAGRFATAAADETGAGVYAAVWPPELVPRLVAAARERGLPHGLWGLEPEAFGSEEDSAVAVDVRPVLERKLAALRCHRTQLAPDHLLTALPGDIAAEFLGSERWRHVAGPDTLAELLDD